MRGKPVANNSQIVQGRITPADAGKTGGKKNFANLGQDHPRGCGENMNEMKVFNNAEGSPPRMRGKLNANTTAQVQKRITPADAGKTQWLRHGSL